MQHQDMLHLHQTAADVPAMHDEQWCDSRCSVACCSTTLQGVYLCRLPPPWASGSSLAAMLNSCPVVLACCAACVQALPVHAVLLSLLNKCSCNCTNLHAAGQESHADDGRLAERSAAAAGQQRRHHIAASAQRLSSAAERCGWRAGGCAAFEGYITPEAAAAAQQRLLRALEAGALQLMLCIVWPCAPLPSARCAEQLCRLA